MSYKNGGNVLPAELLDKVQQYIQGELIYIPKVEKTRAAWGTISGSRAVIKNRNKQIYRTFKAGTSIKTLALDYCLSEDSIKKIVSKYKKADA